MREMKFCISVVVLCATTYYLSPIQRSNDAVIANGKPSDYFKQRQEIIAEEQSEYFGAKIVLDELEQRANRVLMRYKHEELEAAFEKPSSFLPSRNFARVSHLIERSRVFRTIRLMPKAGMLHVHLSSLASRDFIIGNVTRRANLYVCRESSLTSKLKLKFLENKRNSSDCFDKWELLDDARRRDNGKIDAYIAEALTIDDAMDTSHKGDADYVWRRFEDIFRFLEPLLTYRPVCEDFLHRMLEEVYEDNVQFVEIRAGFSPLYELDGRRHGQQEVIEIYNRVVDRFVKDHPNFLGVKWIYSRQRNVDLATFANYLKSFRDLSRANPDLVVGFDLIGREDKARPLTDFIPDLLSLSAETRFFFHAGETDWYGQVTDENLVDAVLLNAKRIGHGYALTKHPQLTELVKDKGIAIEISPISNQVLKLVDDLRNHPASYLFARNLPLVVSSDDPGFWGARALSFDFYEAFVGIMSVDADLRALKQLALNSIEYSSLDDNERLRVIEVWESRWREFVREVVRFNDVD